MARATEGVGLLRRVLRPRHNAFAFFAHQNSAQIMHGQQKTVGDRFQLCIRGLGLRPVGGGVEIIHRPQNIIDIAGSGVLAEDVFDPEVMEELAAPPGQLNALKVNELKLTIAGAELTGDGEFAFNNQFGIPMPSGVANLMLVGGNGLLDTLVGMGLVPEEQAMGARMMMGLFARPGDGEDTLVSTIEVKEEGSILANGQRIQ